MPRGVKKDKKDPAAPKRPLAPFMYFCQEERPKLKAQNPTASIGELGKILGEKWKALDPSAKAPFEKLAAADQERYKADKVQYQQYLELNPPAPSSPAKGGKGSKKKKDPNAPKRPLAAFMFFSQQQRPAMKESNPAATIGDLGKLLGKKWNDMTDEQKKPYVMQAEEDKKRYEAEKAAYERGL